MNTKRRIDISLGRERAELVIKDARYLNVFTGEVLAGDIAIDGGYIVGIGEYEGKKSYFTDGLIIPGLIDSHVHIESSLCTPEMFSVEALRHGTTTVVCDPHEIANVAGVEGIEFMRSSAKRGVIDFKFMLPSCVPATKFDRNFAPLSAASLSPLYRHGDVIGLAEVMDVGAVLNGDDDMLRKIGDAKRRGGVIDGHAPSLSGKELNAYVGAGITSDHECTTLIEAMEKLRLGQYIMIREGTAAKNLSALVSLINKFPLRCMLATDDLHPDYLLGFGHIDRMIQRAIELGADPIKAITCATFTPSLRFGLNDRGAIAVGRRADLAVWDGEKIVDVFCAKRAGRKDVSPLSVSMHVRKISALDVRPQPDTIALIGGQIVTEEGKDGENILFACERHHGTGEMAACRLGGYGLRKGAVATSIAHDSHNVIAAGASEADIAKAVNRLTEIGGGIVVTDGQSTEELPLEIGGIMTGKPLGEVALRLEAMRKFAYSLGISRDVDPFMSLSFLSLPVIPKIRLLPSGVIRV